MTAGAVLYVKDVARVAAFYTGVAGLPLAASEPDHVVLRSADLQLVVLAMPPHVAADVAIADPPQRREETPVKLVLPVPSVAAARAAAPTYGGVVDPPEREWTFQGDLVCDGHDPEGNVVQLRESRGA